ncbi:MAG TPA: tyrosine-type recombinase/integrase [Micromonosporaceae bacterium]|jgi:integrase/recombinase XerD|nr:tyrosine-type recombinase/integrase [Micromonosporaceae bacterium]
MTGHPPLRDAVDDYLSLRRALGFKLATAGRLLGQFLDYLDQQQVATVTVAHALTWATSPTSASTTWHAIRLSAVRGFAVYLHSLDATVAVPPADLLRHGNDRATPYLYSDTQIRALITAAGRLQPGFRAATYQTLIGLLAATGIRISEAIALDTDDLDPTDEGQLLVRRTKFGKDRLVPLHPSTTRALADYLHRRDQEHSHPRCPALLVSTAGTRLHHSNIALVFNRLATQVGILRRSATCRPRIHDVRHSFAVATLTDWYRSGADVPAMMPRLATYLGHTDPKNTFWYLSAAPELMALVGQRLNTHLAGRS